MSNTQDKNEEYEIIIQSNQSWFYVDWQGLFHYKDLLFLLVRRDFLAKYKQTILGPAWFILQPLLTTIVFTVVFGKIAKIPTDGLPPTLFYLCALLSWGYFSQTLNTISLSLIANAHIFGKVYFPRLIVPLSAVISNLFTFSLQLMIFLGFYFYFKFFTSAGLIIKPNVFIYILPVLLVQTAAISLGFGLWIAAITVKYRDFQHLLTFFIQLWMYATPIIYPISIVPEKWRIVVSLNPMVGIVESYRYAFFGTGLVSTCYLLVSAVGTLFVLITGILVFNRAERTFVDWI